MAAFLSDAWLSELSDAAAAAEMPDGARLVVQQVVVEPDGSETAYAVRVEDGRLAVVPGRAEAFDVSFTQHRRTAVAIARGERSAQAAFLAGDLRIGGDVTRLSSQAALLGAISDLFARVRATTQW